MEAILNAFLGALNAILAFFGKEIKVEGPYAGDIKGWWDSLEIEVK